MTRKWSVAAFLPVLLASSYWYAISPPWFCSGLCCLSEATCKGVPVNGHVDPKYDGVVEALGQSLKRGWDLGASLYVMVDGESVVDVAGGFRDRAKTVPYDGDTVNLVFSSGKVIETIGVAILVDKGLVELDAPITTYWPEFGRKGKAAITIKDILSHRSGSMSLFEETPSVEILQDPGERDRFLASQKFLYPPGTVGYRGWFSAFYSDAICRRVDPKKRSLSQLVQDEVFDPLGETFFCPPVPEALAGRASDVHDVPVPTMLLGVLPQILFPTVYRTFLGENHHLVMDPFELSIFDDFIFKRNADAPYGKPSIPDVDQAAASYNNRSSFLTYEMMSANCMSNARGLGRALDAFISGKLVGEDTLSSFMKPFPPALDLFLKQNVTYLAGGLGKDGLIGVDDDDADCSGWGGIGGSSIVHCSVGGHSVTLSYVPNGLSPRIFLDRAMLLLDDVVEILSN